MRILFIEKRLTKKKKEMEEEKLIMDLDNKQMKRKEQSKNSEVGKEVEGMGDRTKTKISDSIGEFILFRSLESTQLNEVLKKMEKVMVKTNDILTQQEEIGEHFYVIEKGIFDVFRFNSSNMMKKFIDDIQTNHPNHKNNNAKLDHPDVYIDYQTYKVHRYTNEGYFGELALMYRMPRSATVVARSEGIVWSMKRSDFRNTIVTMSIKRKSDLVKFFQSVPLLETLTVQERLYLTDAVDSQYYNIGETIISEGDPADCMYFIEDGIVEIYRSNVKIGNMSTGEYFGELALLMDSPRTATVRAETFTRLAILPIEDFEALLGPCREILQRNITKYESTMKEILGDTVNFRNIR
ncbi:hypothetical protein SNEBB_009204 [Seison nebaliae]|nr:hypothetical protein SNEBB_009204 [Seison nebaliae]